MTFVPCFYCPDPMDCASWQSCEKGEPKMTEVYRPDDAGGEYEVIIRLRIPRNTPVDRIVTADLEAQAVAASILAGEPSPRDD